jgi:adenosylmethionine-8-amino-7-oxononanoate aminotransferase
MNEKLQEFLNLKQVKSIRQTGMIAAVELYEDIMPRVGLEVYKYGLKNGVLLRPLANVIYFMPPYVIKKEELDKVFNVAMSAIMSLPKD